MRKTLRYIVVSILLLVCSGCFPVFVPVDGGGRGHEHHDRGEHRGRD